MPAGSYFIWLIVGILVVSLLTTILANIQGFCDQLGSKLHTLLARRYYDHILTLPLSFTITRSADVSPAASTVASTLSPI
ncbi:hypothetical protein IPG36_04870 [bacterium]|nr:MAG: hypothetical protein IPG36_04870 [bacterium]